MTLKFLSKKRMSKRNKKMSCPKPCLKNWKETWLHKKKL